MKNFIRTIPFLVIIASFGPYIFWGIRTEHFVVYLLFIILVLDILKNKKYNFIFSYLDLFIILVLWVFITLWTFIITLIGLDFNTLSYKIISHLENYTQPIVIIIIISFILYCMPTLEIKTYLYKISQLFIFFLLINTFFVTLSVSYSLFPFLRYFIGGLDGPSLWLRCDEVGRHLGIFNQPVESGMHYSLGLFLWGYIIYKKSVPIKIYDYLVLFCLLTGGILSISKLFLFGGIPIFMFYFCLRRKIFYLFNTKKFILISIILIILSKEFWIKWKGKNILISNLQNLIFSDSTNKFNQIISGDRYIDLSMGTVPSIFSKITENKFFTGFGFGLNIAYDNGLLEFYAQGGIIALLAYLVMLSFILIFAIKNFKQQESKLLLAIILFIIGGHLGSPVVTMNRFSTILWTLFVILYFIIEHHKSKFNKNEHSPQHP